MSKNLVKLEVLVILVFIAALAGCSKKDEIKALKEQLAKTQDDLEYWKGAYDAVSQDYKRAKAARRDLGTRLDTAVDSVDIVSQSAEQQINAYVQQITDLQAQIQDLNTFIDQQDAIIAEQEAALQEFMDMVGQPVETQAQNSAAAY
jgi:chromosome segregation ATPase